MPSRPDIELKVPSVVHPGDKVKVTIKLDFGSRTSVDSIDVDLKGSETVRDLENASPESRVIIDEIARVSGETILERGSHTFEVSLPLPDDAPASYTGYLSDIVYSVGIHVDIPWWPDARDRVDLIVTPRPMLRPKRSPVVATAETAARPLIEVALDDRAFAPGEEITGALALGNIRGHKVQGISLSLVGTERIRMRSERVHEAHRTTGYAKATSEHEGVEIPFRFRLPQDIKPTFDAGLVALTWAFEARVMGITVNTARTVPILIGPFRGAPSPGAARRRIGSNRWREVWVEAAARGGLTLEEDDLRIRGAKHGCEVSVWIEGEGELAGSLAAELRWASWEIGLNVARASLTNRMFGADEDTFGNYRIEARSMPQGREAMTAALRGLLTAFDSGEMKDDRALVHAQSAGLERAVLQSFLERVSELAAAVRDAEARVSPPASMATIVPSWRAFAGELGGRLVLGSMSIRGGGLEGGIFDIETHFTEKTAEPSFTRIVLAVDPPLPRPFDPESSAALSAAPPGTREVVVAIKKHARALRASEHRIEADVDTPLAPPERLREPMREMVALLGRLRGDRRIGPYR
jgi:sporulation-control protein spo0M